MTLDVIANSSTLRMKTPEEYLNEQGSNAQYSGWRRKYGVNTDVWIGTRSEGSAKYTTYEWYFLKDEWTKEGISNKYPIPLGMVITNYLNTGDGIRKSPISYNYGDFRYLANAVNYERIVRKCDSALTNDNINDFRRHFGFRLSEDATDMVRKFEDEFRLGILKTFQKIMRVTYVRITDIKIEIGEYSVYVMFMVSDKLGFYGNNAQPIDDVSLVEAVVLLEQAFANGTLSIKLELPDNREAIMIKVDTNSLNELVNDGNSVIIRQSISNLGFNGGSVFILVVFSIINGLVLGILIIELHYFKFLNLPCFQRN